ncbi:MAG: hypothetical protein ABR589_00340 [Chthoniobacterales bacterium]
MRELLAGSGARDQAELDEQRSADALRNPALELHDRNGGIMAFNRNWKRGPKASGIRSIGLAPSKEAESAILIMLPQNPYTAIVRGKNGDTGVGLVEVYDLQ